jgi:3-phenylpropionate/trans-cinnamate dioxygenase ferredoxin reductase subunit
MIGDLTSSAMTQRVVRWGWLAFFAAVLVVPVVVRLATTAAEPMWRQLADVTGLLALSGLVCAAVLPSRIRSLTRAFGIEDVIDVHRFLGVASGVLVLVHVACVLAMNPAQVALLDPALNGPPAEAASVATGALVMLVVLAAARRRLNQRYEVWRWMHVLLAITVLVASGLHVYWLDHLLQQRAMQLIFVLLALAVGAVLLHRWVWRTLLDPSTEFVVTEVRRESESVTTVGLAARDGSDAEWDFAPGQFAWLRLCRSVTGEEHPFTIASSPHLPGRIEFTIRHAGDFTRSIDRLRPGQPVWIDGPHGSFTSDVDTCQGVVMIAGGVGITPMMSMVRAAADRRDPRPHRLVVVARSHDDLLFRDELGYLRGELDFEVTEVLRRPHPGWEGHTGEINIGLLTTVLGTAELARQLDYFLCGPPGLVHDTLEALEALGVPPERIHTEQFDMA